MPKYKTLNEDIVDLLKYGNYDYLELIEYAENEGNMDGKFSNFEFGYKEQDCADFLGNIKLFPFFSYGLNFRLASEDNKSTKVMFASGTRTFQVLEYFSPSSIKYKTLTKITCRNHFISRVKAWDKFVESNKHKFLKNTERYMDRLSNSTIDDINNYLTTYHFGYNVSMESMRKNYESFKLNLDENIEMIKQFKNPYQENEEQS